MNENEIKQLIDEVIRELYRRMQISNQPPAIDLTGRHLITEAHIMKHCRGAQAVRISSGSLITPLAEDAIHSCRLTVIRE